MFCLVLLKLVAFPERKDAIFETLYKNNEVISFSSGSIGFYKKGKCHLTSPNMTIGNDDDSFDWCSNIAKPENGEKMPWIAYRVKNKRIRASGYAIRSGCCRYECCCLSDSYYVNSYCCCALSSYSLQASDDNVTWRTIHKVENEVNFYTCTNRVFEFDKVEEFTFVRFTLDKPYKRCPNCFALNRFEVFGETIKSYQSENEDENDESVSIIGKINKNNDF